MADAEAVTTVELPFLPIDTPSFDSDPMPFVDAARREHPWLATSRNGYVVHGYQAMKDLLSMDDRLLPAFGGLVEFYGAEGTDWAKFMREMLLAQSGPDHKRIRAAVADAFTPRNANRLRGVIREVLADLLDTWAPRGSFDFAQFASHFPVTVLCRILGTSPDSIPAIRDNLDTQAASVSFNRDLLPDLLAGHQILWTYIDDLIVARERSSETEAGSLLDSLIATKNAGRIDETELRFLLMVLFPAGYDTSKNLITMTLYVMLDHPDLWARCAEDRAYCTRVTDEILRHSSVAGAMRIVAEDFTYDGFTFTKGARIICRAALTGRDPAAFDDPMTFDPDRVQTNRHVGFGRGAHMCLGQHLARVQVEEAIHMMAQRITHPRLAGEVSWRPILGIWGPRSLPIAFDPAPAREAEREPLAG